MLNKNINFNKNRLESKRENPTHSFRETNCYELELAKEKRGHFCIVYFLLNIWVLSLYSVLNTLTEYTYFYISKNIISYTFLLVFKIVESLQCILKSNLYFSPGCSISCCVLTAFFVTKSFTVKEKIGDKNGRILF